MALILSKIYERGIEKSDRKFPTPNRKKYLIYQEQGSHGVIAEREQVCFETGTAISRIILIRLDRRRSWRNWKAWSHSRALMLTYSTTRWFVTWTTIASAIWICWTLDDTTSRAAPRNSIGIASISAATRSRTFWRGSRWPANFQTTITSGSLWCMDTNISANWRSYEKTWVVSLYVFLRRANIHYDSNERKKKKENTSILTEDDSLFFLFNLILKETIRKRLFVLFYKAIKKFHRYFLSTSIAFWNFLWNFF